MPEFKKDLLVDVSRARLSEELDHRKALSAKAVGIAGFAIFVAAMNAPSEMKEFDSLFAYIAFSFHSLIYGAILYLVVRCLRNVLPTIRDAYWLGMPDPMAVGDWLKGLSSGGMKVEIARSHDAARELNDSLFNLREGTKRINKSITQVQSSFYLLLVQKASPWIKSVFGAISKFSPALLAPYQSTIGCTSPHYLEMFTMSM